MNPVTPTGYGPGRSCVFVRESSCVRMNVRLYMCTRSHMNGFKYVDSV